MVRSGEDVTQVGLWMWRESWGPQEIKSLTGEADLHFRKVILASGLVTQLTIDKVEVVGFFD